MIHSRIENALLRRVFGFDVDLRQSFVPRLVGSGCYRIEIPVGDFCHEIFTSAFAVYGRKADFGNDLLAFLRFEMKPGLYIFTLGEFVIYDFPVPEQFGTEGF